MPRKAGDEQLQERHNGELYIDYFVRLFENKELYKLDCTEIAALLNKQNGENFGESKYRKEYRAFQRGREYERAKLTNGVCRRILTISDTHIPFNLPISTFSEYSGVVDTLVLNGDLQDCQSVSKFAKKYRIPMIEEMIATRQYIIDLVKLIRPKEVVITKGNHEDRLLRYLSHNINEDLLDIMPDSTLELVVNEGFKNRDRRNGIEQFYSPIKNFFEDIPIIYEGKWFCKVGQTIFAHPLAYSTGMLKTAEKAADYFLRIDRDFDTIVLAHTHKLGQFIQGGINMFEQGCCCRTEEMQYADGRLTHPQQKGFLYLCQDKDGKLIYEKSKLISL